MRRGGRIDFLAAARRRNGKQVCSHRLGTTLILNFIQSDARKLPLGSFFRTQTYDLKINI